MPHVTVRLERAHCRATEDIGWLGSQDELYVVGAIVGGKKRQGVATIPMSIDNGETRDFPHPVVFEGDIDAGSPVRIALQAYDEDSGKDWAAMQSMGDQVQSYVDNGIKNSYPDGSLTGIADPTNEQARNVLNVVIDALQSIAKSDDDDLLGTLTVDVDIRNPANKYIERNFSWDFSLDDSDYTIDYKVCVTADGQDPAQARAEWVKAAEARRRARF